MESKINLTTVKPVNYKVTAALINQVPLPSQEPVGDVTHVEGNTHNPQVGDVTPRKMRTAWQFLVSTTVSKWVTLPTWKQLHTPREATKHPAVGRILVPTPHHPNPSGRAPARIPCTAARSAGVARLNARELY